MYNGILIRTSTPGTWQIERGKKNVLHPSIVLPWLVYVLHQHIVDEMHHFNKGIFATMN